MIDIKVLGSGCPNCKKLEKETRAALDPMGLEYSITKVTDFADIAAYGVLTTPGLVVGDTVVSSGRIPQRSEIVTWVTTALLNQPK
jgi:small redox-active disulfide protein 2